MFGMIMVELPGPWNVARLIMRLVAGIDEHQEALFEGRAAKDLRDAVAAHDLHSMLLEPLKSCLEWITRTCPGRLFRL